jgi:pilus assembly protein CpaF
MDMNDYLRRPTQRQAKRADLLAPDTITDKYESQAWDWIEAEHPNIMLHREHAAVEVVQDIVAQAVAHLGLPSPKLRNTIAAKLRSRLIGAGAIDEWMNDPEVSEITVANTRVRIQKNGKYEVVQALQTSAEAVALAQFLCDRAGARYQPVKPLQTIMWPGNGARINVVHESISGNGGPLLTIRKRNRTRVLDLPDLIDSHMLNDEMADLLIRVVRARGNVAIAGATNTGKTTVLRALAKAAIPITERIVTIEDIDELQLVDIFPDCVSLIGHEKTDSESADVDVSLNTLLVNALRMTPERVIVGEVRGAETKVVLEAGVTEAGGTMFTVHLREPDMLFQRFYWMLLASGLNMPPDVVEGQTRAALDLIVHISRREDENQVVVRRITNISEVRKDGVIMPLWDWIDNDWVSVNPLSPEFERRIHRFEGSVA